MSREVEAGTALITGAARGLGLEFARQYLADGWRVLACVRRPGEAQSLAAEFADGARLEVLPLDVRQAESVSALATRVQQRPIDLLLNVAGTMGLDGQSGYVGMGFGHTDYSDWEDVLRTNVFGPMRLAESLVEQIAASRERKIVNLTSVLGSIGRNEIGGLYAYRSSKAALNALTRSMAIDLRPRGITVIALHPGWVRTDMGGVEAALDPADSVRGMRSVIARAGPDGSGRFFAHDGSELPW